MIRIIAVLAVFASAAAVLAACTASRPVTLPARTVPVAAAPVLHSRTAGIVADNLGRFDAQCGCRPSVAVHYVRFGEPFSASNTDGMLADGATPLLELEPYNVSLAAIAAGHEDAYFLGYARAVAALHVPVLMSFAPEANGDWYSWGTSKSTAAQEVAAWRRVVTDFRKAGAAKVRWMWIVNRLWSGSGSLPALWPGSAWVNEIGIDGYFQAAGDTFASLFAPTITAVRRIAPGKPVLITETGASPQSGKTRAVKALTGGVSRYGLAGFIWFDINQAGETGEGKADWSLDDPAALAAFRTAVKEYG